MAETDWAAELDKAVRDGLDDLKGDFPDADCSGEVEVIRNVIAMSEAPEAEKVDALRRHDAAGDLFEIDNHRDRRGQEWW